MWAKYIKAGQNIVEQSPVCFIQVKIILKIRIANIVTEVLGKYLSDTMSSLRLKGQLPRQKSFHPPFRNSAPCLTKVG